MNLSLRNFALAAALAVSGALFAQGNVIFEEDFEWLAPWAEAGKCGDTVGEDNESATSPQIVTPKVDDVTALQALEAKGYTFLRAHDEGKKDGECIYLNKNYLKFGKTSYQSGLTLPALAGANGTVTLDFDWSGQRRTSETKPWDVTNIVVIVKNGDTETQYTVPGHVYADGDKYEWLHASIVLENVNENSAVSIRNCDAEWANGTHRWFIDNIKVTAEAAKPAGATLTTLWKTHNGITANVRGGNGFGGKVYVVDGSNINTIDKDGNVATVYTAEGVTFNKGLFVDEAGNMLVAKAFPTGKSNWMNFLLISADGQTAKDIEVKAPKNDNKWADFKDNRADMAHRAIGDFFSEDGGLCYLTGGNSDAKLGCTYPLPIYIANGEFVQGDYSTGASFAGANTTAYAIPSIESMDDFDEDEMRNTFYYYTGNDTWNIGYVNDEGEAAYLPKPNYEEVDGVVTYPGLPEGWKQQTQNGFDVFTLGGKQYIIRMVGPGTWCPDFLIQDEDGNIVAHTDYMLNDDGFGITGSAGYGCGVFARKVSDYKAEIYHIFKAGAIDKSFAAMYTFEVPAPELYMAGQFQGWDPKNPAVFTFDGENYVYEFEKEAGGLKISTVKGEWDAFNSGVLGVEGQNVAPGNTYDLVPGNQSDIILAAGKYTLTVNLNELTLKVDGEEYFTAPELYLRGAFNEWGYSDATKFASDYTVNDEGNVIYTLKLDALEGEFKIATTDWGTSLGKAEQNITANGTFTLAYGGTDNNLTAPAMKNVELTLTLPNTSAKPATLKVSSHADRKAFAYEVKATLGDNNNVALTYKASAPAKSAAFVVTDAAGTSTSFELPAPVKGANEATVALTGLEIGDYTYAVELISELAGEEAALAYKAPEEWVVSGAQYGGPVFIRDTREAAFGYVVVGMSGAKGFAVYNPEGELMYDGPIHANYEKFAHGNSEIMSGDAHKGYAVFSNWNDKGSAAWLVNPLDATEQPRGIFETEGATCDGNGLWSLNGVNLGGGQTGIAFQDNGEETMMFTFDEDLTVAEKKNVVHGYKIGEATSVVAAPVVSFTSVSGKFASKNVQLKAGKNGVFAAQRRALGMDTDVPTLAYLGNDGSVIWDSGNKNIFPASAQGIAINSDESLLAMGNADCSIDIYQMEYDNNDEPVFTHWLNIPMANELGGTIVMAATFDAADNLLVYNRHARGYHVFALPGESTASTKGNDTLKITNGVENITVDANAPVEYFNLQGIRVENPSNGIFIRRQGNTATKVTIK